MHRFDGGCESIPPAGHRFDVAGRVGGISKGRANFPDRGADSRVHVDKNVTVPETLDDFLASTATITGSLTLGH
jgi:hypothetical protein